MISGLDKARGLQPQHMNAKVNGKMRLGIRRKVHWTKEKLN
jgi:hypothetical protein